MFETFAVLSTVGCIAIFIALVQAERKHRNSEEKPAE
jgi:hypothetical protein